MVHLISTAVLLCIAVSLLLTGAEARIIAPPTELVQLETKQYAAAAEAAPRADDNSEENYRLPNNTLPIAYNVELWNNAKDGVRDFRGIVKIDLQVVEETKTITLHARETSHFEATIKSLDSTTAAAIDLNADYELARELLTVTPIDASVSFAAGTKWTLTISYNGTLRLDNGGFYQSTYTDSAGKVHYLATTQFESTNARHAFPCYDEPQKRAKFDITINHDPSYTAISNMPKNEARSSAGITVFDTTPVMSTYLVAFIISDFEYTEGQLNNLPQRIYTREGTKDQQEWALVSGMLVESSLANYFGVPFALPKLDQAGIPDFAAGAMENWGMATYREQYMLWTKESSTINAKTNIANIIGHEYAHMWFGDLVSIKWWTYLWLKEGFATIFSYEADDIAFPEWNIYQIFHVSDYHSALINDASATATPMTHYVQKPGEISARYNTFSYAKPGSVLYMFKNAWTDEVFRLGLNKYLVTHQYNSCDEWDLFASLQAAADELKFQLPAKIADIFSSWSHQGGYPLLTVTRNYEDGSVTVTQQRYNNDKDVESNHTWYVPINYALASNPDFRNTVASHYLLNEAQYKIAGLQVGNEEWLILNKQSSGYYRINYDERNWELIADGLIDQAHKVHPRNRAQLMHDAYRFVDTKRLDHKSLLHLMSYLRNENQYAPWSTANSILNVYDRYLRADSVHENFRNFVIELVEEPFDKLGVYEVPGEHYLNNYLRNVLISLACQVGSQKCQQQAHNKLKQFLNDGERIEPTVRTQALCGGLRKPEDAVYDAVLDLALKSTAASDRSLYLSSLGCSQTIAQLQRFVQLINGTSNNLSNSERTSILSSAYTRSENGLTVSLEYLEANWESYAALSTGNSKPLDAALRDMANYVVSEPQQQRLTTLLDTIGDSEHVQSNLKDTVNTRIESNFAWLDYHRQPMTQWFATYFYKGNGSTALTSSLASVLLALALILAKLF